MKRFDLFSDPHRVRGRGDFYTTGYDMSDQGITGGNQLYLCEEVLREFFALPEDTEHIVAVFTEGQPTGGEFYKLRTVDDGMAGQRFIAASNPDGFESDGPIHVSRSVTKAIELYGPYLQILY